jgi:hypothetical protein
MMHSCGRLLHWRRLRSDSILTATICLCLLPAYHEGIAVLLYASMREPSPRMMGTGRTAERNSNQRLQWNISMQALVSLKKFIATSTRFSMGLFTNRKKPRDSSNTNTSKSRGLPETIGIFPYVLLSYVQANECQPRRRS